jgi:hypothetical protein
MGELYEGANVHINLFHLPIERRIKEVLEQADPCIVDEDVYLDAAMLHIGNKAFHCFSGTQVRGA